MNTQINEHIYLLNSAETNITLELILRTALDQTTFRLRSSIHNFLFCYYYIHRPKVFHYRSGKYVEITTARTWKQELDFFKWKDTLNGEPLEGQILRLSSSKQNCHALWHWILLSRNSRRTVEWNCTYWLTVIGITMSERWVCTFYHRSVL